MAGLVRADNPLDEQIAFEWATEAEFGGGVQVHATSVTLVLDGSDGFWEKSRPRTWDLAADLTRCFEELQDLRGSDRRVPMDAADVDDQPVQAPSYDGRGAASA